MPGPAERRAYLGLGGNIGEPRLAMASALRALDVHERVSVVAVSSLYRTPPWGKEDQPDFLNAVACVETDLGARALLDLCLDTERSLKRIRAERWGPRVIDVDILLFGNQTISVERLQVPHPRLLERAFALAPLAEIAPKLLLKGRTPGEWLSRLDSSGIVRLPGGSDWWRGD